jgi:hypothetical protein
MVCCMQLGWFNTVPQKALSATDWDERKHFMYSPWKNMAHLDTFIATRC